MKPIPMNHCRSEALKEFGYDAETQTLSLKFNSGTTYHYAGVPKDLFDGMVEAAVHGSIGRYYGTFISRKFPGIAFKPDPDPSVKVVGESDHTEGGAAD